MMDERRFYETLVSWQARDFDWPTANCCHFAADVARCWGIEFEVPPSDNVEQATAWLREQGARSLYDYLRKRFGNPKPPLQAKRGWIAYRKGEGLEGARIGTIDRKGLFVGDRGLNQVPLAEVTCAFNPERWRG